VFVKNAKNVEIIVDVAFGVIPTVLGIGAAGLLGSGIINTAKEVRNNISLLKTFGPGLIYGGAFMGKGLGKGLGKGRDWAAEKWPILTRIPGPNLIFKPPKKKGGEDQNTQSKQDEQGGGGGGGNPPTPPEIKASDKKEEQAKISGIPIDEYIKKKRW
jgi:hypothetical protein